MNQPSRQAEAPGVHPLAPVVAADAALTGIMVAAPMYGGMCHDAFLLGMLDLRSACDARRIPLHVLTIRNESLVQRARNTCVAHFLASDASHLMFIDSDIGFTADAVLRLVAHGRPVVGATYAKKSLGAPDFALLPLLEVAVQEGGLVEVHSLPTGFLLLHRDAVQRMVGAYGAATRYRVNPADGAGAWTENLYALFDCERDEASLSYFSEDYTFCQRWRRIGGQCWLDPHILLEHHGTARFAGHPWTLYANKPGEVA
jgi:hypothetical protein